MSTQAEKGDKPDKAKRNSSPELMYRRTWPTRFGVMALAEDTLKAQARKRMLQIVQSTAAAPGLMWWRQQKTNL